jgi:hypothetical protein
MPEISTNTFEGFAIVELMGHRSRGGYVKDVEMFGGKLLRIDIPVNSETTVTEFYGCSAIYALRPCTEAIVREHVKNSYDGDLRPVRPLDYREREQPAIASHRGSDDDDDGSDTFDRED